MKPLKFTVKVPGTSANLGPGFDIMGLALNVKNEFTFFFDAQDKREVLMHNQETLPFSLDEDFVFLAFKKYFSLYLPQEKVPNYRLILKLELPLKGGLGSSASALVAGFLAAYTFHKKNHPAISLPSERDMLYHLALMEGHPDNTTPAFIGGLVFAYFSNGTLEYYKHKFPGTITLFAFTPDQQMCTNASRKALPESYPGKDVVFNMSRISAWYEFLASGKPGHLLNALQDKIHTPYRITEDSVLAKVIKSVKQEIIGYSLSGSGPTLLFYVQRKKAEQAEKNIGAILENLFKERKMQYKFFRVKADRSGAAVS